MRLYKNTFRIAFLSLSLALGTSLYACSSDDPDQPEPEPTPAPTPDPEPEPEPEPTPTDREAQYFDAAIAGTTLPSLGDDAQPLEVSALETARNEIWEKWKAAVAKETLRLPASVDPATLDPELYFYDFKNSGTWKLSNGENMSFLFFNKGAKPAEGYPTFIFLHGSGADAKDEWGNGAAWANYFDDGATAYFIPGSPQGGTGCRWFQPSRQLAWERVFRQAFVGNEVNPKKIYFAGISEGAYGTQRLASFYADYLAGAGAIAGGEPAYNCPSENTANIAFCLQTGSEDTMYGRSRVTGLAISTWAQLATEHPGYYVHKINLQRGEDHGCDYTTTTPWLVKHERNATPKFFHWENYAMGNINGEATRTREAFYNIRVLESQNGKCDGENRDTYIMNIDGQTVDIKILSTKITPSDLVSEDGWTMNIAVTKTSTPATKGKIRVYLDKNLVDLTKPVEIKVNGVSKFNAVPALDRRVMAESVALFFDPLRVFPAAVDVEI